MLEVFFIVAVEIACRFPGNREKRQVLLKSRQNFYVYTTFQANVCMLKLNKETNVLCFCARSEDHEPIDWKNIKF